MKTLTDRKIAEQEKVTYDTQRLAEDVRKELAAGHRAGRHAGRASSTPSGRCRSPSSTRGRRQDRRRARRRRRRSTPTPTRCVLKTVGDAEARKDQGGRHAPRPTSSSSRSRRWIPGNYAVIEIAKALAASGFKLVPDVVVSGNAGTGGDGGNSLVSVLLANLIRDGRANDKR